MVKTDVWGNELYVKVPEPESEKEFKIDDKIEQAFREGYQQGYKRALEQRFKLSSDLPILERLTDDKTAEDLGYNCRGLMMAGVGLGIDDLRYVKLAALERELDLNDSKPESRNNNQ